MKSTILLLAVAALIFSSCSSAYKTGQTPDDVYFSPAPKGDEYVKTEKKEDKNYKGSDQYYEDRYLRMRVQNRYQWSALDDYYFNSPYAYNYYGNYYGGYNMLFNPYNNYWMWNNYYNPYCHGSGGVIIKPGSNYTPIRTGRPIAFNVNSYSNPASRSTVRNSSYYNGSNYNNSNRNTSLSNTVRKVYVNTNSGRSNNNYSNSGNNDTPSRSYNPSSSNSGSRSSSSSSSSSSSNSGGGGGGGRTRAGR